ncbi:MAG: hypothetical protein ACJAVM_003524 [Sulfitobacter sp.]
MFKFPVTLMFLAIMTLANFLAGTLTGTLPENMLTTWGIGHGTILNAEFYRLITGTFLSHDIGMYFRQMGFVLLVVGYVEWTWGSAATAGMFFGIDIIGTLVLLGLLTWLKPVLPMTQMYDVGMSIGGFGLIGVIIAGGRWKLLVLGVIEAAIVVKYLIVPDLTADIGHGLALILGVGLAAILAQTSKTGPQEASHAE